MHRIRGSSPTCEPAVRESRPVNWLSACAVVASQREAAVAGIQVSVVCQTGTVSWYEFSEGGSVCAPFHSWVGSQGTLDDDKFAMLHLPTLRMAELVTVPRGSTHFVPLPCATSVHWSGAQHGARIPLEVSVRSAHGRAVPVDALATAWYCLGSNMHYEPFGSVFDSLPGACGARTLPIPAHRESVGIALAGTSPSPIHSLLLRHRTPNTSTSEAPASGIHAAACLQRQLFADPQVASLCDCGVATYTHTHVQVMRHALQSMVGHQWMLRGVDVVQGVVVKFSEVDANLITALVGIATSEWLAHETLQSAWPMVVPLMQRSTDTDVDGGRPSLKLCGRLVLPSNPAFDIVSMSMFGGTVSVTVVKRGCLEGWDGESCAWLAKHVTNGANVSTLSLQWSNGTQAVWGHRMWSMEHQTSREVMHGAVDNAIPVLVRDNPKIGAALGHHLLKLSAKRYGDVAAILAAGCALSVPLVLRMLTPGTTMMDVLATLCATVHHCRHAKDALRSQALQLVVMALTVAIAVQCREVDDPLARMEVMSRPLGALETTLRPRAALPLMCAFMGNRVIGRAAVRHLLVTSSLTQGVALRPFVSPLLVHYLKHGRFPLDTHIRDTTGVTAKGGAVRRAWNFLQRTHRREGDDRAVKAAQCLLHASSRLRRDNAAMEGGGGGVQPWVWSWKFGALALPSDFPPTEALKAWARQMVASIHTRTSDTKRLRISEVLMKRTISVGIRKVSASISVATATSPQSPEELLRDRSEALCEAVRHSNEQCHALLFAPSASNVGCGGGGGGVATKKAQPSRSCRRQRRRRRRKAAVVQCCQMMATNACKISAVNSFIKQHAINGTKEVKAWRHAMMELVKLKQQGRWEDLERALIRMQPQYRFPQFRVEAHEQLAAAALPSRDPATVNNHICVLEQSQPHSLLVRGLNTLQACMQSNTH